MPTTNTTPADGLQTSASAQVLNRRVFIIRNRNWYAEFAPPSTDPAPFQVRLDAAIPTQNLSSVYISLYLCPAYDRGDVVFQARTDLQWRPVFQMPPDVLPTTDAELDDISTNNWLPLTAPAIVPVGIPIARRFSCLGAQAVSVEIRIGAGADEPDQGEDRLIISIGASQ